MENLFAKDFPGLFTTYGDYIVHAMYEVHLLVVAIRVNCAAAHLYQPKQIMITQQSHDKIRRQITLNRIHIN